MLQSARYGRSKIFLQSKNITGHSPVILQYTTEGHSPEPPPKKVTFREKYHEFRNSSNFKYWVIGTTAFASWMAYYGLKSYKKTRIEIDLPPDLPTHAKVRRSKEIEELMRKHSSQANPLYGEKIKKLLIQGAPGSGKTNLVYDFVKELETKQKGFEYGIPKSSVTTFLQCDSENSFLRSLKLIAAQLKIKLSDLEECLEDQNIAFNTASFEIQCDTLLQCIVNSLKKHPRWIFVFDHLQATSPQSVGKMIKKWFLNDENTSDWSKGTVVIVYDGVMGNQWNLKNKFKYTLKKSMIVEDACALVKEIVNLDATVADSSIIVKLLEKVNFAPFGVLCVGLLLREKLSSKEIVSIEHAVNDVLQEIDENIKAVLQSNQHLGDFFQSETGFSLIVLETVIAMVAKKTLADDLYIRHGFDVLASLKPNVSVPQSLLARHLNTPFYKLPPLAKDDAGSLTAFFNKQQNDLDTVINKADEFEPKGKAWSNKNLAEYIRKVEEYFGTAVQVVKEIYNLVYGVLPPLPERSDGLDMFRSNDLLAAGRVQPGGAKSVSMHPLIFSVIRQHFLANTVHLFEENHVNESQSYYDNQSWYRKLSGFSEQACLTQYRSSSGHDPASLGISDNIQPGTYLFRYNLGIDFSAVLKTPGLDTKPDAYWIPKDEDKLRYLQDHISRVITSLCDEIHVSKEDMNGRTVKKLLLSHLEYILQNQPQELLGTRSYISGLQTVADCHSDLYKDMEKSREMYENILHLQKSSKTTNPLDIGKTMMKLAEIQNSYGQHKEAKSLLEEASELYEVDRRKHGEYKRCVEYGKLLGLLGVVYASLNRKGDSKETIERSLMLKQATPPDLSDEAKSKQYGAEFASSLTDLGHSYVSLGLPLYGKKILDLALSAHKNLHGENHTEVVRTTTILAVAHLMQGHNDESRKLRKEAAKLQAMLNTIPMY